jgi:uncharacterized protein YbjT (DUF2867 family)
MEQRKALLLGATGLTGSFLLKELLESDLYSLVTVYGRKSTGIHHPKLVEQMINLNNIQTWVEADDVFCCLGATIKTVKTREAFTVVDLYGPLQIAKLQLKGGSKRFFVMSAAGANANSSVFYNRTKGRLEEELGRLGYASLYIFQPSFIIGERKEKRLGEQIGIAVANFLSPFMVGGFKKYIPVKASTIAKCMMHYAAIARTGILTIPSDVIKKWEQPEATSAK